MYLGWDSACVFQLTNSSISWFITSIFWEHLILVAEYVIVNIIPFWTLSEISSKDWIYKRYLKGSSYILKVSQSLVMLINIYIPYFSVFESYTNKIDQLLVFKLLWDSQLLMGRLIEKVDPHDITLATAAISTLPCWKQAVVSWNWWFNVNNNIALKQQ